MSKKYDLFKKQLVELCTKHDVQISTSGYDHIVVEDADASSTVSKAGIYDDAIVDMTETGKS